MLKRSSILLAIFAAFFALIGTFGCGGGGGGGGGAAAPAGTSLAITSFTPTTGRIGDTVTITGTGFSTTAASNTVHFNGTAATVTSSTATQIVTTVPTGATTGAITVTVGTGTATSSTNFTVDNPFAFAGSWTTATALTASYWNNASGNRVDLAGAAFTAAYSPTAYYNGTVYTAGRYSSDGITTYACYWAGTTFVALETTNNSWATGIAVDSSTGTVYVSGVYFDSGTGDYTPYYWIATGSGPTITTVALNTGTSTSTIPMGVALDSTTVYIVGYYTSPTTAQAVPIYWSGALGTTGISTAPVEISLTTTPANNAAVADSLVVSGGTIYAGGYYNDATLSINVPCFWSGTVGGTFTFTGLTPGSLTDDSVVYATAMYGTTLYLAGSWYDGTQDVPSFWSGTPGGTFSRVDYAGATGNTGSEVTTISVPQGVVYAGGYYVDGTTGDNVACWWTGTTNGTTPTALSGGTGTVSSEIESPSQSF